MYLGPSQGAKVYFTGLGFEMPDSERPGGFGSEFVFCVFFWGGDRSPMLFVPMWGIPSPLKNGMRGGASDMGRLDKWNRGPQPPPLHGRWALRTKQSPQMRVKMKIGGGDCSHCQWVQVGKNISCLGFLQGSATTSATRRKLPGTISQSKGLPLVSQKWLQLQDSLCLGNACLIQIESSISLS